MKVVCYVLIGALLILTGILGIIFSVMFFVKNDTGVPYPAEETSPPDLPAFNCTGNISDHKDCQSLKMITRSEWLAQPPQSSIADLNLPAHQVILSDTRTDECHNKRKCTQQTRFIQTRQIEVLQFDDVLYNFLIGGDGNIYEGRGWFKQSEIGLRRYANNSYWLGLIGNFTAPNLPEQTQIDAVKMFANHCVKQGKLISGYTLLCDNKLSLPKDKLDENNSKDATKSRNRFVRCAVE